MDKYHIYEEVGAGAHSQVFKGREKMSIEYVAIKRVDKSMMESVISEVQVIHRLRSPNVLKFYDWYETRNNVWLILEFCPGGDLHTLIKQDHREPESAVRLFGVDLLAGLQQTHAGGFLHGDLRPSNVLIDEYGILKLSGYGLSRGVADVNAGVRDDGGENAMLEQRAREPQKQNKHHAKHGGEVAGAVRDPAYMAPELFSGTEDALSFASDFWSLGCILFELRIGEPPFQASPSASVAERIARENPPGLDKGEWQGAYMSPHFCALVGWLLQKDPFRRPTWPQLLAHPFWGSCQTPSLLGIPAQPRFDRAAATENRTRRASAPDPSLDFFVSMKHEHAADALRVNDDECRRLLSEGACGETSPGGEARCVRQTGQIEVGEDPTQRRSPRRGGKIKGADGKVNESERDDDAHRGLERAPEVASCTKAPGKLEKAREEERPATAPRISPRNGDGQQTNEKQYERAQHTSSSNRKGCSNRLDGTTAPNYEPSRSDEGEKDSLHSFSPPSEGLVAPGVHPRRVFPSQGQSRCIGETAVAIDPSNRHATGNEAGCCSDAEVAEKAVALKGFRVRARIMPATGENTSPSGLSPASASSSAGEQYGSSFEEDTEGSSTCSATGEGCGGVGTSAGRVGSESSGATAQATVGVSRKGHMVVTPGSVRTATMTSPSTGRASGSRGGGFSSDVGRARGAFGQGIETVDAINGTNSMSTVGANIPGDWRWRQPEDGLPSTSSGASAASVGSRHENGSMCESGSNSRLDFPLSRSGSGSGLRVFSNTALSPGKSAGSSVNESISSSSMKLSPSTACSVQSPAEIAASGGVVSNTVEEEEARGNERRNAMWVRMPSETIQGEAAGDERNVALGKSQRAISSIAIANGNGCIGERTRSLPSREQTQSDRSVVETTDLRERASEWKSDKHKNSTGARDTRELLLHESDAQVTPIVGHKTAVVTLDSQRGAQHSRSQLPFKALLPVAISAMPAGALEAHLTAVYGVLVEASVPTRQRGQTLLYLQSLAPVPRVANLLINSTFLVLLLRLLRKPRPAPIRDTVATLIGLLVRHATYIAPEAGRANDHHSDGATNDNATSGGRREDRAAGDGSGDAEKRRGGLMSALIATIRERPTPGRATQVTALRRNTMAALGELLFYVVTQESHTADGVRGNEGVHDHLYNIGGGGGWRPWSVSAVAVRSVIWECLEESQHENVRHVAAKTLENVLAQARVSHPLVKVLVTPELALRLFDLASNSFSENLRGTAASGLSHILGHNILGDECDISGAIDTGGYLKCDKGTMGQRRPGECTSERRKENNDSRKEKGRKALHEGWIASRVMCQPGAAAVVLHGLSEGSSPACRQAFLNMLNLIFWGAAGSHASASIRRHPLSRAAEVVLESQHLLLPGLLRIAEHGEGAILRAKGFLALRLTLEVAPPSVLLKACRSRLLPLLSRVVGALALRTDIGADDGGSVVSPGLSPHEEYMYECGIELADWLCKVPERAARRLLEELRRRCSTIVTGSRLGGKSNRRRSRHPMDEARSSALTVAMDAFPAVAHLVISPLLRTRAITDALVCDLSACLALSCPVDVGSAAGSVNGESDRCGASAVLAALLPTVEALAQQSEESLLPHREAVSSNLIPVLCRLLGSPSGDIRALALAVLRVLLPPLLRPVAPSSRNAYDRWAAPFAGPSAVELEDAGSPARVRVAIAEFLLPLVAALLSDHAPVPQYIVRLLLDVAREWRGVGTAILAEEGFVPALLTRLPMPLPPSGFPPWTSPSFPRAVNCDLAPRSHHPQSVLLYRGMEQRDATAAALDPAVAALLTFLIEICVGDVQNFSEARGAELTAATILRSELPGRAAAAVVGAVEAKLPEAADAFLGLAVALVEFTPLQRPSSGANLSFCTADSRQPEPAAGERVDGRQIEVSAMQWEAELEPLLAAVPAALEGMRLFCLCGGVAERRDKLGGKKRDLFIDDGVRLSIAEVTTLFFEACHQLFRDRFLRSLAYSTLGPAGVTSPSHTSPAPATTAIICRHVAEFLDSPTQDEHPRLRILRILLAAASARDCPLGSALGQGPLWAVLLRLATGRAGSDIAVKTHGGVVNGAAAHTACANGVLVPTQALAREVVSAVRRMGRVDSHGGVLETLRRRSGLCEKR